MSVAGVIEVVGGDAGLSEAIVARAGEGADRAAPAYVASSCEDGRLRLMVVHEAERDLDGVVAAARELARERGLGAVSVSRLDLHGDSRPAPSTAPAGLDFYQQADLWDETSGYANPSEHARADRLAAHIRDLGVSRVLDAGAGNGIVANRLQDMGLDVVAFDHSDVAMHWVQTEKVVGPMDAMPFAAESFEAVLCSEVLEHLPDGVFAASRTELGRVASRFVVVTVPNAEDLFVSGAVCPSCRARSSPWRHVQRFAAGDLADLIPGFHTREVEAFGPMLEHRRRWETLLTREALDRWPWPYTAVCPQCGFQLEGESRRHEREAWSTSRPSLQSRAMSRFRRHEPKWLLGTFARDA